MTTQKTFVFNLLQEHFAPVTFDRLSITERRFPSRVRADLQRSLDELNDLFTLRHFSGCRTPHHHQGVEFADLISRDVHSPITTAPAQYEEVDIGEAKTVRCALYGLWLIEDEGVRVAIFLQPPTCRRGIRVQVAAADDDAGVRSAQKILKRLETAIKAARSYRGKILSLERGDHYDGTSAGIKVHKLRTVSREQIILRRETVELLDRNVIQFAKQRGRLAQRGLATKKGLLFYGPPGTGKTHTLHYLVAALPETTTLLISAEQVGYLTEYMTLARLLQPSLVVIEDADLIARDRETMSGPGEEVLLNKLLNEMDGLKEDAEILFVLTTNRPEALEAALASRPGRIDQAIEFPHPDAEGRAKLMRLYAGTARLSDTFIEQAVLKTAGVSAAFIKELLRRATQFQLERDAAEISSDDLDHALEELLFAGGALNRQLLGGNLEASQLVEA